MKQKPPPRYFTPLAELAGHISAMPPVMPPHDVKPLMLGASGAWSQWCRDHKIAGAPRGSMRLCRYFLSRYINSFDYKQAILANAHRYDLDGNVAGDVTAEEKAHAQEWLDQALASIEAREANAN